MQYPEEKWDDHLPDYYRGVPALVTDQQGRERNGIVAKGADCDALCLEIKEKLEDKLKDLLKR